METEKMTRAEAKEQSHLTPEFSKSNVTGIIWGTLYFQDIEEWTGQPFYEKHLVIITD